MTSTHFYHGSVSKSLTMTITIVISLLVLAYLRSLVLWRARCRGRPLPPGPKTLPLIGNMFDMPSSKPWIGLRDLCQRYGDILYFQFPNQPTVVLGNHAVIAEILEKHAATTSDRQVTTMTRLTTNEWAIVFLPYGKAWRNHRRALWQHFNPAAISKYTQAQSVVIRHFLGKLLNEPEHLREHIRYTFAAFILKIVYGIEVKRDNDEIIASLDTALEGFAEVIVPGRLLVDAIPILQYVPAWFPGAGFQKQIKKWKEAGYEFKNLPFSHRRARSSEEDDSNSARTIVEMLLAKLGAENSSNTDVEELVKNVAAAVLGAGSDTSFSTLLSVFLAMSLYPDVQKKAQAELGAVVGPNRLPEYSDREALVYINAIVKESLRWMNVSPLGFPHCTMEDDVFQGYFIPAGTLLLPNVWACMHDPEVYEDPDVFRPERFIRDGKLDPAVRDPSAFVFGFGRRICPGRYFADASLFLNVACVLHVFNITPPLEEHGNPIVVTPSMSDGPISYPEDYRCTIKPRSEEAAALILSAQAEVHS